MFFFIVLPFRVAEFLEATIIEVISFDSFNKSLNCSLLNNESR